MDMGPIAYFIEGRSPPKHKLRFHIQYSIYCKIFLYLKGHIYDKYEISEVEPVERQRNDLSKFDEHRIGGK